MDLRNKVIPDEILEDFYCKKCLKYLTITPILASWTGANLCGRCQFLNKSIQGSLPVLILTDDFSKYDQFSIPFSLLDYQMLGFKVPCVNRFDGCTELLSYPEIQKHEENCSVHVHGCPICNFTGIGAQMITHFQQLHQKYHRDVVKFNMNLKLDYFDTFLYRLQNVLTFVQIFFDSQTHQIFIESKSIGASIFFGKIRIRFKIIEKVECSEFQVLSHNVLLTKDSNFVLSFKFEDYHFLDAKIVLCSYELIM